jgi:hypothetical protein
LPILCQRGISFVVSQGSPTAGSGGPIVPPPLLLYSTNTTLKYRIQKQFCGDRHHVWCSPFFEGAALNKYAIGRNQPASSDPSTIYRDLCRAVDTKDGGCLKIGSQKKVLKGLAGIWLASGAITRDQRNEIVAMVTRSDFSDWRPLLFVIPYATVTSRVALVPRSQRASHEPEYIIRDLADHEFNIIELPYRL